MEVFLVQQRREGGGHDGALLADGALGLVDAHDAVIVFVYLAAGEHGEHHAVSDHLGDAISEVFGAGVGVDVLLPGAVSAPGQLTRLISGLVVEEREQAVTKLGGAQGEAPRELGHRRDGAGLGL